jgi:hypothetical protein
MWILFFILVVPELQHTRTAPLVTPLAQYASREECESAAAEVKSGMLAAYPQDRENMTFTCKEK